MITPDRIAKRKVTIPTSNNNEEYGVAQTEIHFGNKNITLLVGPDLLLRFQYKDQRGNQILKRLKDTILKDKKIFTSEKQKIIQKILVADREIRELLNKDKKELTKRDDSLSDDFLNNLKRRQTILRSLTKKLRVDITKSY